jgi:hypothetical protein
MKTLFKNHLRLTLHKLSMQNLISIKVYILLNFHIDKIIDYFETIIEFSYKILTYSVNENGLNLMCFAR